MEKSENITSKVLINDNNHEYAERIKRFCNDNSMMTLKPKGDDVMEVLKTNIDLSAIFLSEDFCDIPQWGLRLGEKMHQLRPELPIFLRRDTLPNKENLEKTTQSAFCCAYTIDLIDHIKPIINKYIFNACYPNKFLRGLQESTEQALKTQFKHTRIDCSTPYLSRDKIMHGEVFSLIPLESNWCRGYLMLQMEDKPVIDMMNKGMTLIKSELGDFRMINALLSEITNLVWGAFRSRYASNNEEKNTQMATQVPIVVNYTHRFVSFGSNDPQLCFKYALYDDRDDTFIMNVYQKIIFNLHWMPEDFSENDAVVNSLIESGEIELF